MLVMITGFSSKMLAATEVSSYLTAASAYADSAYFSNVNGTYWRTISFSDSCRRQLNAYYRQLYPNGTDTLCLLGDASLTPPEIIWLHDSLQLNYDILLTIRNEKTDKLNLSPGPEDVIGPDDTVMVLGRNAFQKS